VTVAGPSVGVVGAGVTGLSLTHHLAARGVESVTFEASESVGGVVRSTTVDGRVLELGPQRTRLTPGIEELVEATGLREDLLAAADGLPLFVYARGRLREVPFSLGAFVRTDLLSWPGKLRVLAEPATGAIRPEETAAEAFTRKFGREAYENLVGPLFGGTYGSDPAAMPARYALSGLMRIEERDRSLLRPALRRARGGRESPPPVSFREGMQQLPRAVYEANRDRVQLGTPVEAVERSGDRYALVTADGETEVDDVVLTTPAGATADVLADLAPDAAESLRRLTYNSLVYVHLVADDDRRGFGYQVRREEPLETLGVTWNAGLFDRDGVYTVFLGGMHRSELLDEDDETLGHVASEEFEQVMETPASVLAVTRVRDALPAYDHSWAAIDDLDLPEGIHLATNYTARVGIPGRVREAKSLAERFADRTEPVRSPPA